MYRTIKCDKDTYITDRVISDERKFHSNLGKAGTLDLYKLYGVTLSGTIPNVEKTRLLVHFNLDKIRDEISTGALDVSNSSFFCTLKMFDVYGGQPTPENFVVSVNPLSKSFYEGRGTDVVFYGDYDECNFLTASRNDQWILAGCDGSGSVNTSCDFFTGSRYDLTQEFITGEEDLEVDVTDIIRDVLTGSLPDSGFRISLSKDNEEDQYTYFVKRFSSRHAFDESKHPKMIFGFNDSIIDDSQFLTFDTDNTIFLYNKEHGVLKNITSGSTQLTGSNCLTLLIKTPISGGVFSSSFSASQHKTMTGVYSSSFKISSTPQLLEMLNHSGSVLMTPIWLSNDSSKIFSTGSVLTFNKPEVSSTNSSISRFVVTAKGVSDKHGIDETLLIRVNIFDYTSPLIKVVKTPVESQGAIPSRVQNAFFSVRDVATNERIIPFETQHNATRISLDSLGMFFKLNTSDLAPERSYVIDVMIVNDSSQIYLNASQTFKVSEL